MRIWIAALGLMASLATVQVASANTITNISGSGVWESTAPVSSYSAPLATWQFSFNLPTTLSANPTTQATAFTYLLNGVAVPGDPTSIEFFAAANLGLFDIHFPAITVSLFSPTNTDVGSSGTLIPGVYPTGISINDAGAVVDGTITIVQGVSQSAVPEPSSMVLLATALLMGGGLLYYRKTLSGIAQ